VASLAVVVVVAPTGLAAVEVVPPVLSLPLVPGRLAGPVPGKVAGDPGAAVPRRCRLRGWSDTQPEAERCRRHKYSRCFAHDSPLTFILTKPPNQVKSPLCKS
jgi:hypothetical protein